MSAYEIMKKTLQAIADTDPCRPTRELCKAALSLVTESEEASRKALAETGKKFVDACLRT